MPAERMRILHLIESGGLYGAEKVILNLSGEMRRAGRHVPIVGCITASLDEPCALYDEARRQGLEAVRLVIRNGRLPLDLPRAGRQLRRLGIDLVHSHGYKPSVWGYACRPWSGVPIMATCHLWFTGTRLPRKMKVMLALEKIVYRRYRDLVAVSRPISEVLQAAGIPADRIHIIENGVEVGERPRLDAGQRAELRASLGLPADAFVVLNAARLNRQKGQWNLVEAAAQLRAAGREARFLIVGDGPLAAELQELARARGVADLVTLAGFRDDVDDLLQAADAFALPSLDEGMPMSLLEAVARGVPVVTTAVGDIPHVVCHRQSGLVVPLEDPAAVAAAVDELRRLPDRGASLAAEARRRVAERYSCAAMYSGYERVYARYAPAAAAGTPKGVQ